jgi:hypothetical protein
MNRSLLRFVAFGVLACAFALNGWLYAHGISHSLQHAHHSAASHADPLCSWLCSAGQSIHALNLIVPTVTHLVARAEIVISAIILTSTSSTIFSRGPPYSPFQ